MRKTVLVLLLLFPSSLFAEERIQFPTQSERNIADVASWITVSSSIAIDAWSCRSSKDPKHCYLMTGIRASVTVGASEADKHFIRRDRPCTPQCGIDSPNTSLWSEHTALAFSTIGSGPRLSFEIPLAISTGSLRVAAGKHWVTDTLVGAGVGLLTSRIR